MKRVYLISFWAISGVAAMVCLLCDFVISNKLDWSLIVGLSIGVCGLLFTICWVLIYFQKVMFIRRCHYECD